MSEPRLTLGDYNTLAREAADLRDDIASLKAEWAETQERWVREITELRRVAGASVDEITDEIYEDTYKVLEYLKDRCWEQGRAEGLREARSQIENYVTGQLAS